MSRSLYLVFAGLAYILFLLTFLLFIAFVGNLPGVPIGIDRGPTGEISLAAIVDIGLIILFGIQHSAMARRSFKHAFSGIVPPPVERSIYVLASSLVLLTLIMFWRPIPATVWIVESMAGTTILWLLFAAGWSIVLLSTFLINHFELFGLQQAWFSLRGRVAAAPVFYQPLFYKFVRHPLYAGFVIAFWATPAMSLGHLLFAIGMSAYILIAIQMEERDLIRQFGSEYEAYRVDVGMLVPRSRRKMP